MGKILVTGFEPFGLIRGHLARRNSSRQMVRLMEQTYDEQIHTAILPVNDAGVRTFRQLLREINPSGIFSMGENLLSKRIKIEPYANHCRVTSMPLVDWFTDDEVSAFAQAALQELGQASGSTIGGYYCNQIYLNGLEWSRAHRGAPVVFLHIPVVGNRAKQFEKVKPVFEMMRERA